VYGPGTVTAAICFPKIAQIVGLLKQMALAIDATYQQRNPVLPRRTPQTRMHPDLHDRVLPAEGHNKIAREGAKPRRTTEHFRGFASSREMFADANQHRGAVPPRRTPQTRT
jgi:hypothetical protein